MQKSNLYRLAILCFITCLAVLNQNCSKGFKVTSNSLDNGNLGGPGDGGGDTDPVGGGDSSLSYFTIGGYQVPYIVGRTFDPNTYQTDNPPTPGTGHTYYVDGTNGNDNNDGLTLATAFKTINKGKGLLNAGDNLYIRRGIYREKIEYAYKDGTAQNRILISAYGDGEVVIDPSPVVNNWSVDSGSVYKATGITFLPGGVVVNDKPLIPALSRASMTAGTWFFDGSSTLYTWTPTGAAPNLNTTGVLERYCDGCNDQYAVHLYESNYFTFYGLTIRLSKGNGIMGPGTTLVQNCITKFNNKNGVSLGGGKIIKNFGFFNTMQNWPRGYNGFSSGGWAGAYNTTGLNSLIQGSINFHSGGEGFTMADGTLRDNINVNSFSVGYYIMSYGNVPDGSTGVVMDHNLQICNPLDMHEYYTGTANLVEFDVKKRMLADGITTGNEFVPQNGIKNVTIANNIVLGCKKGYTHNQEHSPQSGIQNVKFVYNTIVTPQASYLDPNYAIVGLNLSYNDGMNYGSLFRNNLFYMADTTHHVLSADGSGEAPSVAGAFQGITIDHNIYFNTMATTNFFVGYPIHSYDFAQYLAIPGFIHGQGDQWTDVRFVDPTNYTVSGVSLQSNSPAINAGVDVGITTDFWYHSRSGYDLGALQH